MVNNFNNFLSLASTSLRVPEDNADVLKHVGVLTIYKILYIYIYICVCVCSVFVGLDNKLYEIHCTYIKIIYTVLFQFFTFVPIISRFYPAIPRDPSKSP